MEFAGGSTEVAGISLEGSVVNFKSGETMALLEINTLQAQEENRF